MTTPIGLELVWAKAGGVTDPGDSKYQLGWVAEIPTYQNFNYVLKALDNNILSYAESGVFPWQDKIAYEAGTRVVAGGITYVCVTSHNDSAGTNPQDPVLDTTNSYWVCGTVFSSTANAFGNLTAKEGIKLDEVYPKGLSSKWEANDLTIRNANQVIALNNEYDTYNNLLFGNVRGKLVVVNTASIEEPDGRDLLPINNANSHEIFHEGHPPTQAEVAGTIPTEPQDGRIHGRKDGNWVEVAATTVSVAPPPPIKGNGQTWFNLDDARFYIDINDGDSSQWVPTSTPVIPDLSQVLSDITSNNNSINNLIESLKPVLVTSTTYTPNGDEPATVIATSALPENIVDDARYVIPDLIFGDLETRYTCIMEVYVNNIWTRITPSETGSATGSGAIAGYARGLGMVIQTGGAFLLRPSRTSPNIAGTTSNHYSLPCRVWCYKDLV